MSKKQKLELLAPAGSPEKMEYAFAYGADAVYMGIPDFSLRVRINKFDLADVKTAIATAHKLKKKIYVTANIYAHNEHLEKLPVYLKKLNQWRPDALIISDLGVMMLAKKYAPKIKIHVSTQANVTNWAAAKFWADSGASRIILGREVTLKEIKVIHKKYPKIELEHFVHGAMCMSYSGRCMLSAWLTGRSANLGDCAQPCRWQYGVESINAELTEPNRSDMKIPVEEDKNGTYIFNSKDLCLIEYLGELIDAGIVSFKIEGRAKSVAYLSTIVKAYREGLDPINNKRSEDQKIKKKLKNLKKKYLDSLMTRGYTTGFLFGRDKVEQNTEFSHINGEEQFVGEVVDCVKFNKKYLAIVKVHNVLQVGDKVRIMIPGEEKDLSVTIKKMYNKDDKEIESAHGGTQELVMVLVNKEIKKFSILFKSK
ncbi:MAG TPA: peptidase U32 [Candidatus Magasanikbacteria bacterium]|nr:peptidase U32 [Candidatus Magasanikbacteria bacterium]